ncbi:MAG: nucleoside kinase, partial [Clostridia bacterium]|nr:nucleoside kinase [Clostridia bacterium]
AAVADKHIKRLNDSLNQSCKIEFVDLSSKVGVEIYTFALIILLARVVSELFPEAEMQIKYSLGKGIYGEIEMERQLNQNDVGIIENRMRQIVEADEPFESSELPKSLVMNLFRSNQYSRKRDLLSYWLQETVKIVTCGGYSDFYMHPLISSTGVLKVFALRYYMPGFLLLRPLQENPQVLPEYQEPYKYAKILQQTDKWADIIKVRSVVDLNHVIEAPDQENNIRRLIDMEEGKQEKDIIKIAEQITDHIDSSRLVLIAGPSASGKTTFIKRLANQLRINGLNPVSISADDYFLSRELTPRNENGEYDFECLEAINLELFNQHLSSLIQGEEIELPYYDFKSGLSLLSGKVLQLKPNDLLIIEGIHCLNDRLTLSIPNSRKFKIYIGAWTHLVLDNLHRVHAADIRLLRRMVRDARTRDKSPQETLRQWPLVRRGEENNIFPFQNNADVVFNSALAYEIAVLKKYAEPLLKQISSKERKHWQAQMLLQLLSFVLPMDSNYICSNSLLREFIGEAR